MSFADEKCSICDLINKIYGIYSFALILTATVGNFYSSFICFRLGRKKKAIFKILAYIFIFNALSLYTWMLDIFLTIFFYSSSQSITSVDTINIIESMSIPTCKIFAFNQFFTLHTISWLLVYSLVHQNIQLYFPKLKYNVKLVCLLIIGFFFLFNSHIIIFAGKIDTYNETIEIDNITENVEKKRVDCYIGETFGFYNFFPVWDRFHLFVYSFIPFVFMITCNIITIYKINKSDSVSPEKQTPSIKNYKQKRKLAITLLVISLSFIICSSPETILYGFYFKELSSDQKTFLILKTTNILNFTFIGFKFLIFLVANRIFRNECIICWYEFKKWLRFKFFKWLFLFAVLSETKYSFECDRYFRPDTLKLNDKGLQTSSLVLIN